MYTFLLHHIYFPQSHSLLKNKSFRVKKIKNSLPYVNVLSADFYKGGKFSNTLLKSQRLLELLEFSFL